MAKSLSFTDVDKYCFSREVLKLQICLLRPFEKIRFSRNVLNLEYIDVQNSLLIYYYWCNMLFILMLSEILRFSLASFSWNIGKLSGPRSDATVVASDQSSLLGYRVLY